MSRAVHMILLGALLGLSLPLAGCASAPEELKVERVVLYQSGVAYVERRGEVRGDEIVLRVRPDQIDDILSSLVVVDMDGGATATVSLPARGGSDGASPIAPGEGGMVALLEALRGADVRVRHGDRRLRGRLVGVDDGKLSVLVGGTDMHFIDLDTIREVELENDAVAMRVRQSLDESMSDEDWQSTEITLRFPEGRGAREIRVAWVVEMPLWKPAYRVIVGEEGLHLQGWAVVDNLTGEDWNDVRLSLASGTPLSFRFDLHSPIRIQRPDMSGYGTPTAADLRPPEPMRARPAQRPQQQRAQPAQELDSGALGDFSPRGSGLGGAAAPRTSAAREQAESDDDLVSSVSLDRLSGGGAEVRELDALYTFDLPERVTLPDRTSTLVTLLNTPVDGEDLLVFQPGQGASQNHPYRALMLRNTTGAPLQAAPVAIYREGAFVGEAISPRISPNESGVLPYALENRVHVNRRQSTRSGEVQLLRIQDGRLIVEVEGIVIWRFEVSNSLSDSQTLHVQVPRQRDFELLPGDLDPDSIRREENFYLVPIEVEPGEDKELEISQVRKVPRELGIYQPEASELIVVALSRPDLRPDVAAALQQVSDALGELAATEQRLAEDRQLRDDIRQRTQELRANIELLGDSDRNAELRGQLLERLTEQDELLVDVSSRIVERSERRSALRVQIQELMRDVTLERE